VQNQLSAKYSSQQLRVYAVWLPMLWTDAGEEWNGTTMPNPRVKHFWDGNTVIGQWLAEQVDGYQGVAWDVYYLYGPDPTWEGVPSSLVGSGGTIYDEREALKAQMDSWLEK
jgi:hypothetical protein